MTSDMSHLKRVRKEKGFSVSQLARKAELAERTIYQIEKNGHGNTETLRKIARALDVSLDLLLPPDSLTGNVKDTEFIVGSSNVQVVKGLKAGRDANIGLPKTSDAPEVITEDPAALDNDLTARLVEQELLKLPDCRLSPEKKSKLIKYVRRHLKTIILDFVENLED